jgi:hypothetical protein
MNLREFLPTGLTAASIVTAWLGGKRQAPATRPVVLLSSVTPVRTCGWSTST